MFDQVTVLRRRVWSKLRTGVGRCNCTYCRLSVISPLNNSLLSTYSTSTYIQSGNTNSTCCSSQSWPWIGKPTKKIHTRKIKEGTSIGRSHEGESMNQKRDVGRVRLVNVMNKSSSSVLIMTMYQVQTNISVQTVQTNCGGEVGEGICKSVIRSGRNYTFANTPSHLSSAVGLHGLHGEVGLH